MLFAAETVGPFEALLVGVILLAIIVPILLAALLFKTWPTARATVLLLPPIAFAFLFFLVNARDALWTVLIIDAVILIVFTVDFCTVAFIRGFAVSRQTERVASLSKSHLVTLRIENRTGRDQTVWVADDWLPDLFGESEAPDFSAEDDENDENDHIRRNIDPFRDRKATENQEHLFFQKSRIPAGQAEEIDYRFKPVGRGSFQLEYVYLTVWGYLGFWKRTFKIPCSTEINVYPDLRQIGQYELLARTQRLHQLGVRPVRRIGNDDEFERLRDYTPDDQYKFIDWRSTAKRNRLTVRDFQMARSQRLFFLIDTGRMMMNRSRGISLLDHSLNAMLMLAYIALRQGDEVGFLCFSNEVRTFIPPRSGLSHINHLTHGCFNIFPEQVESRYDLAFSDFAVRCRKRSLVVLVTNINDQRNAVQVQSQLTNLVGRHLPLGILIRDHSLFDSVDHYVRRTPDSDIYQAGAAAEILNWRHRVLKELAAHGSLTLDAFPEDLTAPLINQYLEIKARHLL